MFDEATQNLESNDLSASAELAVDLLATGGDPDISPAERRALALAVRDILAEADRRADAETILQDAYRAARKRVDRLGHRLQSWPEACPWRLSHVLALLARMADALPADRRASVECRRDDERFSRGIGALLRLAGDGAERAE
jgi:hypothetical protein